MKKCKTCKYWDYQGFGVGDCSGITSSSMVIPIENQPKGKPNGKLITVRSGLITDASFVKTTEDWNCKNWSRK